MNSIEEQLWKDCRTLMHKLMKENELLREKNTQLVILCSLLKDSKERSSRRSLELVARKTGVELP